MLLRKQSSYSESFHAKLQFKPSKAGYEAGAVLWWSMYSYASIGITLAEQADGSTARTIIYRAPTGKAGVLKTQLSKTVKSSSDDDDDDDAAAALQITATPTGYTLSLADADVEESFQVVAKDLTVMPPVGGAFCGTMFGIYSFGKWEPVLDPADFSGIEIRQGS
jgi:hypothetical protein